MTDFQTWLDEAGFERNPFERLVADNDEHLDSYFIPFPYYPGVLGTVEYPQTAFLFAERGGGKTANRIQIERACHNSIQRPDTKSSILGVTLTNFTSLLEKGGDVNLRDYVNEILKQAVSTLFDILFDPEINRSEDYASYARLANELSPEDRVELVYYISNFSNRFSSREIRRTVEKIQKLVSQDTVQATTSVTVDKALDILEKDKNHLVQMLANSIHSLLDLAKKEEFKAFKLSDRPLDELIEDFCRLVNLLKIQGVYIIIDRIDEHAGTQDAFQSGLKIVKPLVESVLLLERSPNVAFKFFLPIELRTEILQLVRTDRFPTFLVEWRSEDLAEILKKRLNGSRKSDSGIIEGLGSLCTGELGNRIDVEIINHSTSPRDLIRLGRMIFNEHSRSTPVQPWITQDEFDRAVKAFEDVRQLEMGWLRIQSRSNLPEGAELLTQTYLSRIYNMLVAYFNLDELIQLCFHIKVPYEDLAGETKPRKVIELIQYLNRRGLIDKLFDELAKQRPHIPLPSISPHLTSEEFQTLPAAKDNFTSEDYVTLEVATEEE